MIVHLWYLLLAAITLPILIGVCALCLCGRRRAASVRCIPALLFHSVPDTTVTGLSHIRPTVLQNLLAKLHAQGYRALTVTEVSGHVHDMKEKNDKSVVLTFDDAFEDLIRNAFPILDNYGMRTTIFVIAGFVGKESNWDVFTKRQHLSAEQLRQIARQGHEIGSHTLTHPDLCFCPTDIVRHELVESKKILEDIIGKPVNSVSFPYGRWDRRIWQVALECGYTHAAAYGTRKPNDHRMVSVDGVYAFDTVDDIMEKVACGRFLSVSRTRSKIMPHFAKGSSLWRFRSCYRLFSNA